MKVFMLKQKKNINLGVIKNSNKSFYIWISFFDIRRRNILEQLQKTFLCVQTFYWDLNKVFLWKVETLLNLILEHQLWWNMDFNSNTPFEVFWAQCNLF